MRLRFSIAGCLLVYGAASFAHHVHNAEFLSAYPNMPAWLTREHVYLAVAPFSSHTVAMHVTILLEVAAAALLLIVTVPALKWRTTST